jgi:hypothetical protein
MKQFILSIVVALSVLFFVPTVAQAQSCPSNRTCSGGCTAVGQCVGNKRCVSVQGVIYPGTVDCGSAQLGGVKPPPAITSFNFQTGSASGNGIILFLSRLINLFVIVCGIWTMFNFLYSGYILISSQSDTKNQSEIKDKLTMTAIGLAIIAGAYIIAGLIGLIFFGDAGYILNPQLVSALDRG